MRNASNVKRLSLETGKLYIPDLRGWTISLVIACSNPEHCHEVKFLQKFCSRLFRCEIYQELLLNSATCLAELYEPEYDGWLCRCVNVCSC